MDENGIYRKVTSLMITSFWSSFFEVNKSYRSTITVDIIVPMRNMQFIFYRIIIRLVIFYFPHPPRYILLQIPPLHETLENEILISIEQFSFEFKVNFFTICKNH